MPEIDIRQKAWSAALIVLFFVAWELFCLMSGMSDLILPRPSQIFTTLFEFISSTRARLRVHASVRRSVLMRRSSPPRLPPFPMPFTARSTRTSSSTRCRFIVS